MIKRSTWRYALLGLLALVGGSVHAQWQSFKWAAGQVGETMNGKAAILFPVKLDGVTCNMQLDTGLGLSQLYRHMLPARYSLSLRSDSLLIEKFSLGSETSPRRFQLRFERSGRSPKKCVTRGNSGVVGTLGNDYFLTGALSLDLAKDQYRFVNRSLYASETARSQYIDIEIVNVEGHGSFPVVTLMLENGEAKKVIFDTGSASLDLVIFLRSEWLRLVGQTDVKGLKPILISRFGQWVTCYRAPINQAIRLGDVRIEAGATAMYCDDPRDSPREENKVFGLLGMSPFSQRIVSVDYVAKKIFIETVHTRN